MQFVKTRSDYLRNEGNQLFNSVKNESNRSLKITSLQKALKCYEEARSEADNVDQLSSLLKNISAAQFSLVRYIS